MIVLLIIFKRLPMSTIKDVAKIANVSTATVSRVVNNGPKVGSKTRDKVLRVMHELGYSPNANARALVTQKSTTIGVVVPDLCDPFFASLASGVEKIARENSMQLLLSTALLNAESEREAINLLLERRCQAIIVHSKMLTDDELISLCNVVPGLVIIDRYIAVISHKCVWLDNEEGGRIAARHLLSLGHVDFACINSNFMIDDPRLRFKGFKSELAEMSIKLDDKDVISESPTLQGGEIAAQKLLASGNKITGIFVYNDAMAIGAISTLEDNGFHVPKDISVIGFDDVLLSRYSRPKLSTLHYPIEEMSKQATQLSLQLIEENGNSPEIHSNVHKYIPRLIKRESTSNKN